MVCVLYGVFFVLWVTMALWGFLLLERRRFEDKEVGGSVGDLLGRVFDFFVLEEKVKSKVLWCICLKAQSRRLYALQFMTRKVCRTIAYDIKTLVLLFNDIGRRSELAANED